MSTSKETIELNRHLVGALNNRRRPGETKEDVIEQLLMKTCNCVELEEYLRKFKANGANFIAVPEDPLADGYLLVMATVPSDARDDVAKYVGETHAVKVGNTALVTDFALPSMSEGDIHFHRRVPVSATEHVPGVDPVSFEDGIENLRTFIREDHDPTPRGNETIPLADLVTELVEAGAKAVTIDQEPWCMSQTLELIGYLPPGDGYDVCGDYDAVTIDGDEYSLSCRFTLDGLRSSFETFVYISDSWVGTDPVTINEGLDNVRELLTANSFDELRDHR